MTINASASAAGPVAAALDPGVFAIPGVFADGVFARQGVFADGVLLRRVDKVLDALWGVFTAAALCGVFEPAPAAAASRGLLRRSVVAANGTRELGGSRPIRRESNLLERLASRVLLVDGAASTAFCFGFASSALAARFALISPLVSVRADRETDLACVFVFREALASVATGDSARRFSARVVLCVFDFEFDATACWVTIGDVPTV